MIPDITDNMAVLVEKLTQPHIWDEQPVFCFTSDIDWASEAVIDNFFHKMPYYQTPLREIATLFSQFASLFLFGRHRLGRHRINFIILSNIHFVKFYSVNIKMDLGPGGYGPFLC